MNKLGYLVVTLLLPLAPSILNVQKAHAAGDEKAQLTQKIDNVTFDPQKIGGLENDIIAWAKSPSGRTQEAIKLIHLLAKKVANLEKPLGKGYPEAIKIVDKGSKLPRLTNSQVHELDTMAENLMINAALEKMSRGDELQVWAAYGERLATKSTLDTTFDVCFDIPNLSTSGPALPKP